MTHSNLFYQNKPGKYFILALVSLFLGACSSSDKVLSRTEQCKLDMKQAKELMADEDYFDAREHLNATLANCTGTGFMEDAQYLLAESYFLAEEWVEAYGEYNIFINHYPSSPQAPMAYYRKGLAAWSTDYVPGRDESYTNDAIKAFQEFARIYPQNAKMDSAQYYLQDLSERLADRELATSILYLKMREPQATAIYLQDFLKKFPESKNIPKALALLVESYTRLDQFEQADKYLAQMNEKLTALAEHPKKAKEYQSKIAELKSDLDDRKAEFQEELEEARQKKLKRKEQ